MSLEAQSSAAAAVATGSGVGAVLSAIGEVTVAILGVPLPVVLAASTGAWIARSYAPAANFVPALLATLGWTIAGCVLAPLGKALVKHYVPGLDLPTNALAGLALVVAGGLPILLPSLIEKARGWLKGGAQ